MLDVLIVGAGPAGSVAAAVLARAGVRVGIVDRDTFPRHKLCGDTINPGTLARLRHLNLAAPIDRDGLRVDGMMVSGSGSPAAGHARRSLVVIKGEYPNGLFGRAISRADLDWLLLQQAMAAGAQFDAGVSVRMASVTDTRAGSVVRGVGIQSAGRVRSIAARVTIAADGRRSAIVGHLGLARHPTRPRRWAVGAYFEGVRDVRPVGEMHIRPGRYIGVAPLPGGLTNVCLVAPTSTGGAGAQTVDAADFRDPTAFLLRAIQSDACLADRFAGARVVRPAIVLGPLAVDVVDRGIDGVILAGDAAGFIDPMTGDGMRFAVRGGELAAAAALRALERGWTGVHRSLAVARHREFAPKWRFNRVLRSLVASPVAIRMAAAGARLSPGLVRRVIARAGDCDDVLSDPLPLAMPAPAAD